MNLQNIILSILAIVGILTIINILLKTLSNSIDLIALCYNKFKVKVYYPIIIRFNKRKHKDYIETYFNELIFRKPIEYPLSIGRIKIEWSDEESVKCDLEKNVLLVRIEYADKVEKVLAKVALIAAPYLISEYLEPALGDKFSRLISIGIIEGYLQEYPNVLSELRRLIDEIYREQEYKEILSLIVKADDTSLYRHVFLYELRKILGRFGLRVDRGKLVSEVKELLFTVANLDNIDIPLICGYYIDIAIMRVGKLEKVALKEWKPYVKFIRNVIREGDNLQRVYIVSAGKYTTKAVENLLEYLVNNIPALRLIDKFEYRARYYKGKTNIPHLVAIMEYS